ncbi:rhomboid family protein [Parasponia andersonii]|uniref:Rhomboid family protein n=1 Tax=Parasponia andersonii TaxID=3476 RepID=A0A2P5C5T6_PARAD|nr:rhomboid family protein [Parasponia andersonii]
MADKPSRALVLYGDGLARFIDPSHTHLHSLSSKASCGFLSLPNAPASESEDERIVREFAILQDACEAYLNLNGVVGKDECQQKNLIPTISERFMGMKAAVITSNSSLKSFGTKLGFSMLEFTEFSKNNHLQAEPPENSFVASKLLELLGFEEGKTLDMSKFDLVFVHIGAGENDKAIANDLEFVNSLVGGIMHVAQPGSEIGSRLHFSVMLGCGSISEDNDSSKLSFSIYKDEKNSKLSELFPRQSYTMKGENQRKDVRHHSPMLIAQLQYAVTRKDMVETFSFKDFKENGGNLVIPADRFLHEVAFKLWKAPKYGA